MPRRKNLPQSPTLPKGSLQWQEINKQVSATDPLKDSPLALLPPGCYIKVHNIVSTFNMSCRLPLQQIAMYARNTSYNPKRFAACVLRIRSPKTTALMFSNGRTVVTGAKTIEDSRLAARKFARIVQKLGFSPKFEDFKVQNVVATCCVFDSTQYFLRLEGFAKKWMFWASWEPEVFAGCVFRMEAPKLCMLIFQNGKIVITGGKSVADINEAFRIVHPAVNEFRVEKPDRMKGK